MDSQHNAGLAGPRMLPALAAASPQALQAFITFFGAKLRNPHTQRAYGRAVADFLAFAPVIPGGERLETITPLHVSAWLTSMEQGGLSAPTIKARLAAVRRLFRFLCAEQVLRVNPAAIVDGPPHAVRRGKTPVLVAEEARQLIEAIDITTLVGLRDRAIIAVMVYTFARIGAVTTLKVKDMFNQQRRLWLRLQEKRGKVLDVPCHHALEDYLTTYTQAAGLADAPSAPLFQTFARDGQRTPARTLSGKPMTQPIAWAMLQRRAADAGLAARIGNHTFRATGITTYLKNGGTIERAATMAGHSSTRTTQLYDRRSDDITLDEIEKIRL